jgi:hypothetical protein
MRKDSESSSLSSRIVGILPPFRRKLTLFSSACALLDLAVGQHQMLLTAHSLDFAIRQARLVYREALFIQVNCNVEARPFSGFGTPLVGIQTTNTLVDCEVQLQRILESERNIENAILAL